MNLLDFLKLIFANATIWADPVIRQVFKGGSGRNILGWITQFRVIDVTTSDAFVFVHESPSKQTEFYKEVDWILPSERYYTIFLSWINSKIVHFCSTPKTKMYYLFMQNMQVHRRQESYLKTIYLILFRFVFSSPAKNPLNPIHHHEVQGPSYLVSRLHCHTRLLSFFVGCLRLWRGFPQALLVRKGKKVW